MDDRTNFNRHVFVFKDAYLELKTLLNKYPANMGADIPGDKYAL